MKQFNYCADYIYEALAAGANEVDRVLVDPIGKRDRSKLDGPVGKLCAEKNIE